MRVEFFEGRRSRQKAIRANSDELCAVAVTLFRHGATLEVDRQKADANWEITPHAMMAVVERWEQQRHKLSLVQHRQRRPYMLCSGPDYGTLHVGCEKEELEVWKEFLHELLSRPESWETREAKRSRKEWERAANRVAMREFEFGEGF
jgi:hypothetical protein